MYHVNDMKYYLHIISSKRIFLCQKRARTYIWNKWMGGEVLEYQL